MLRLLFDTSKNRFWIDFGPQLGSQDAPEVGPQVRHSCVCKFARFLSFFGHAKKSRDLITHQPLKQLCWPKSSLAHASVPSFLRPTFGSFCWHRFLLPICLFWSPSWAPKSIKNQTKIDQKIRSPFEAISASILDPRNLENWALAWAPCTFSRYCLFHMLIDFG